MIATRHTLHVVKRTEARHTEAEFPGANGARTGRFVFSGSRLDIHEQNPETALIGIIRCIPSVITSLRKYHSRGWPPDNQHRADLGCPGLIPTIVPTVVVVATVAVRAIGVRIGSCTFLPIQYRLSCGARRRLAVE